MKKMMLFFASVMFVGTIAVNAQDQDTATNATQGAQRKSTTQTDQSKNYTKDMTRIQASDVPQNLRTTLQGPQYKGWENGTVYRSKNNDGYAVEIKDGSKTKTYRFDASGKPIPE